MFLKLITDTRVKILYPGTVYTQLGVWDVWMFISAVLQYFITMMIFLWLAFASTKLGVSLKHYCKQCLFRLQQLSFSSFYFMLHSLCTSFLSLLSLFYILQKFFSVSGLMMVPLFVVFCFFIFFYFNGNFGIDIGK